MKIALIGPTGFVGSEVLIEASKRGHDITAICRNTNKVPAFDGVTALKADVLDHKQVAEAVAGHDIVVCCFNAGHSPKSEGSIYQDTIEGAYNIIRGTKEAGVRRLMWTGGGSSLFIAPGTRAIDVMDDAKEGKLGAVFPQEFLDMVPPEFKRWEALVPPDTKHEQILPQTRVLSFFECDETYDWSFFSPPGGMYPGDRTGEYTLGGNEQPMINGRMAGISIPDAALAMVDEIENEKHSRKHWTAYCPTLSI